MELTKERQGQLLDCILDMGQLLLGCGAEISRVEDTLSRIGRAYGAQETDVFVITSIISLTMEFPGFDAVTETRRISRDVYSVPRCMAAIARRLQHGPVRFSTLFTADSTRDEVISTFLALLELIKVGRASVVQDSTYAEILIEPATPEKAGESDQGESTDA